MACLLMGVERVCGQTITPYCNDVKGSSYNVTNNNKTSGTVVSGILSYSAPDATYSSPQWRLAANKSITFKTTSSYKIVKITMTFSSTGYTGTWTLSSGTPSISGTEGKFENINNSTVTMTTTTAARIKSVCVYYVNAGSVKTPSNLSFGSTTAFEVNVGEPFTEPTLTAADNSILSEVKYASSNENVAEVNETTGKVTLKGVDGTAKITATFDGNDTYESGQATYTITVKDPNKQTVKFDLSSNGYGWSSTNDGNEYFDGSTYTPAVEGHITMSVSGNVRMWGSTESSLRLYVDGVGQSPNIYNYGVGAFTLTAAGGYLISKVKLEGSSLSFIVSEGEYASTVWTGNAKAVTFTKGSNTPQIKSVEVEYVSIPDFTVTTFDDDFYSLYLDHAVTVPGNVTAYKGKLDGLTLKLEAIEGTIPANTGVLFKTEAAGEAKFVACADVAPLEDNDIKGVAVETEIAAIAQDKKVLVLGVVDGKVGFAQPAEGATTIAANKAYILVPASATAVRIFQNEETGIEQISQEATLEGKAYNLCGQRVSANAKGIVIVNGKKIFNK